MKLQGILFTHPPIKILNIIGIGLLGFFLMVGSVFAAVFDQKEDSPLKKSTVVCAGNNSINCGDQEIMLARHRGGRPHGTMHSMGRRGPGVCPQPRSTPPAPDKFQTMKNPLEATQDIIRSGKELYNFGAQPTACKMCHGNYGNGMGIMATGTQPMPRNFTCKEVMEEVSDGQMFYIITHGSQGTVMHAYPTLSAEQVWEIITYIRQFSK